MANNSGSGKKHGKRGHPLPWSKPGHNGQFHPEALKAYKKGAGLVTQTKKKPLG